METGMAAFERWIEVGGHSLSDLKASATRRVYGFSTSRSRVPGLADHGAATLHDTPTNAFLGFGCCDDCL